MRNHPYVLSLAFSVWLLQGCSKPEQELSVTRPQKALGHGTDVLLDAALVAKADMRSIILRSNQLSFLTTRADELRSKIARDRIGFKDSYEADLKTTESQLDNAFPTAPGFESVAIYEHLCADGRRNHYVAMCKPDREPFQIILIISAPTSAWPGVRAKVVETCSNYFALAETRTPEFRFIFGEIFDEYGTATNSVVLGYLCNSDFLQQH